MSLIPLAERPVCTVAEACQVSTLSRRTIAYAIKDGRIASVKRGARRLLLVPSLLAYLSPTAEEGA